MSILGIHLEGKTVQLHQSWFRPGLKAEDHLFHCGGGFGCDPNKTGTKVLGHFLSDGEQCFVRRSDIEKVVE